MGFFGRMLGIEDESDRRRAAQPAASRAGAAPDSQAEALERYRYMLRTAPPETLEQAHAEAFAKLTPDQRRTLLAELSSAAPASERASVAATPVDDPRALARVATRAEIREPGVLERSLGSGAMGFGASLLSSFAMGFVGSMVAQSFFSALGGFGADAAPAEPDAALADNEAAVEEDAYADDGGDFGGDFDV
jgi:hypothetical protein